jgi:hypothetical protein
MLIVGCSTNPLSPSTDGTDLASKPSPQITDVDRDDPVEPDQQEHFPACECEYQVDDIPR